MGKKHEKYSLKHSKEELCSAIIQILSTDITIDMIIPVIADMAPETVTILSGGLNSIEKEVSCG